MALLSVLSVAALLAVLAVGATAGLRNEARLNANLLAAAKVREAAQAGVQLALVHLAAGEGEARWQADGSVHELRLGEAQVRVRMADEAGKLDLNHAPQAALERLLGAAVAEQIVARRVAAAFASVDELQQVAGVSAERYRAVRWALTVHSRQPGVVAEAAPREVLLSIPGADVDQVDGYIALRTRYRASGAEPPPAPPGEARYFVRNGSATVGVHAQARVPGASAALTAVVDLRRPGDVSPFQALDWRHESPELF